GGFAQSSSYFVSTVGSWIFRSLFKLRIGDSGATPQLRDRTEGRVRQATARRTRVFIGRSRRSRLRLARNQAWSIARGECTSCGRSMPSMTIVLVLPRRRSVAEIPVDEADTPLNSIRRLPCLR